jgi:hypothetical protein
MALQSIGTIAIPGADGSTFDHGAFDPKTRRVFVAHTGRDSVDVIDHDAARHVANLPGFPEAAGVVADDGIVLVTNRGAAGLVWVDAETFKTRAVFKTGPRPNGVAVVPEHQFAVAACIGDESHVATLQAFSLDGLRHYSIDLPGRPRWCVAHAAAERVFLAIRDPSMVLVARLPELTKAEHWKLPSGGAHGLDLDRERNRLYVACDDGALVEVDASNGQISNQWPIAGAPDVTFVNPTTGLVHVAIGEPGLVESINPRTGADTKTNTALGAHTTAFAAPDKLYVFSPSDRGAVTFADV